MKKDASILSRRPNPKQDPGDNSATALLFLSRNCKFGIHPRPSNSPTRRNSGSGGSSGVGGQRSTGRPPAWTASSAGGSSPATPPTTRSSSFSIRSTPTPRAAPPPLQGRLRSLLLRLPHSRRRRCRFLGSCKEVFAHPPT